MKNRLAVTIIFAIVVALGFVAIAYASSAHQLAFSGQLPPPGPGSIQSSSTGASSSPPSSPTTGTSNIATSASVFTSWLPIVFIAIFLSLAIAGLYYMAGWLLNNNRLKSSAVNEILQAIGTAILIVLIIFLFGLLGSMMQQAASVKPSALNTLCSQLSTSKLNFTNSAFVSGGVDGPTTAVCSQLVPASGHNTHGATQTIDYGLTATYLINANFTSQSAETLNELFNWDSWLNFLRAGFITYDELCFPAVDCVGSGGISGLLGGEAGFSITYSSGILWGYVLHRGITPILITENTMILYIFLIQMTFIIIMLVGWPYLLAAGVLLRALVYTRRAGGFLISLVLVGVVIYPIVIGFEYSTLNNLQNPQPVTATGPPVPGLYPVGTPNIPALALCGRTISAQDAEAIIGSGASGTLTPSDEMYSVYCYTSASTLATSYIFKNNTPNDTTPNMPSTVTACGSLGQSSTTTCYEQRAFNLYVLPEPKDMIELYSYWPEFSSTPSTSGQFSSSIGSINSQPYSASDAGRESVLPGEFDLAINFVFNPYYAGSSVINLIAGFFSGQYISSLPALPLPIGPNHIYNAEEALMNLYGIMVVSGVIVPILNTLIMISALVGISSLIGGETNLLGLQRFV